MREGVNLMRSYSCVMFNVYRLSISEFITAKRKQIVGGFWTTLFPQVLTSKWKMALPKQVSQGVLFMPFQTLYLKSLKKKTRARRFSVQGAIHGQVLQETAQSPHRAGHDDRCPSKVLPAVPHAPAAVAVPRTPSGGALRAPRSHG